MYTNVHMYTCIHLHICLHARAHFNPTTHACPCTHPHRSACTHARTHTLTHARACTNTCIKTKTHPYMHRICTQTRSRTYTCSRPNKLMHTLAYSRHTLVVFIWVHKLIYSSCSQISLCLFNFKLVIFWTQNGLLQADYTHAYACAHIQIHMYSHARTLMHTLSYAHT